MNRKLRIFHPSSFILLCKLLLHSEPVSIIAASLEIDWMKVQGDDL